MCGVTRPVLQNVVVHFKVKGGEISKAVCKSIVEPSTRQKKRQKKKSEGRRKERGEGRNFFILDDRVATYTVFPNSGDIAATGLNDKEGVKSATSRFEELCGLEVEEKSVRITNSTYSGKIVCRDLDQGRASVVQVLTLFADSLPERSPVCVNFRSQFFPGAKLKHDELNGTVNIFNNGSYVIIGVRSRGEAERLQEWLGAIMAEFWTTMAQATACAWIAESCWSS